MRFFKNMDEHIIRFVSIILREKLLGYIKSITQNK
jgi:hypothetical protein